MPPRRTNSIPDTQPPLRSTWTLPAIALAVLAAAAPPAIAQPPAEVIHIAPVEITGRPLGEHRLPGPISKGRIELAASRGRTWTEHPATEAPATKRLLLSGDVHIRLASHEFRAARAALWLAPLPADDPAAAPNVWQAFAYLEEVRSVGEGPFGITAERLPVQAIVRLAPDDAIRLDVAHLAEGRPTDAFVREGEDILARRLGELAAGARAVPTMPDDPEPWLADADQLRGQQPDPLTAPDRPVAVEPQGEPPPPGGPIFTAGGIISWWAGEANLVTREEETAAILSGRVQIQYWDRQRNQTLQLSAERAVLFLEPAPLLETRFAIERARGIYMEGGVVATDGQYTVRSPRVFYDVRANRAILIDAVFWTYDQARRMPLYLRADTIRQEAADEFRARSVMLTNTAFFDPDLAIGASRVTLTRIPSPDGVRNHIDARNITLRAAGIPIFYLPILRGDPEEAPLRGIAVDSSRGVGTAVRTEWNMYGLIGLDPPQGHRASFLADWYFDRGPAAGMRYTWQRHDMQGGIFAYGLPRDSGNDFLYGRTLPPPQRTRGLVTFEHRQDLTEHWSLTAEGAYISDYAFIKSFFDRWAKDQREFTDDGREFTNAVHLRRVEDNTLLSFEARARLQDFLVNEHLILSPGYTVDKFPEAGYVRIADDLLPRWPGLLTWTHQYRAGVMRLSFHEPTAAQLGFDTAPRADRFWGIAPDQSPADALRAMGLHEDPVFRFDTRHELSMPLRSGAFNITPFAVGRATAYDQDFEEFSPEMDENYRLWGAAGLTLSTELIRIDNNVSSRLLDLHRIRHIMKPGITLWHAGSTIDRTAMPVYDAAVEDLTEGSAIRFGLDQTWQTQRGGPGRWRSVDVFTLNSELIISSSNIERKSPLPRYFDFRPEYANLGGTFGRLSGAWQVTEILGLGGEAVYDFEIDRISQSSAGVLLQHTPDFWLTAELRYLQPQDQTYAILSASYDLSKYSIFFSTAYDTHVGEFATFSSRIQRRLPNLLVGIHIGHNRITNDTSIGLVIEPLGIGATGAAMPHTRRFGIGG